MKLDVCIRGTGIVGKTTALLLAQQGLKIALVGTQAKKAHKTKADIRSYAINTQSQKILKQLKAWPEEAACAVQNMHVYGDGEGLLAFNQSSSDQPKHPAQPLAHIVDATAIEEKLDKALEYQSHIKWVNENETTVDTTAPTAPLTVICEGSNSKTRSTLGIEYESHSYQQTALVAQLSYRDGDPHTAYQWFDNGDILALLPRNTKHIAKADASPSAPSQYALVWSVSANRAKELQALTAEELAITIANAIKTGASTEKSTPNAKDTNTPITPISPIELHSVASSWPLRLAQAKQWTGHFSNGNAWVLAGDAAHTMHPLAGQGLNCGLADVECLARTIESRDYFRSLNDMRVLRSYEREQKAHWQSLRNVTDGLQRLFTHNDARLHIARNWGMNRLNQVAPLKKWLIKQATGA